MYVTESERLVYRRLGTGDFEDLKMMLADPGVMYAWEHTFSDEQIREWIKKQEEAYRLDGMGYFAAVSRDSGELIGQIGLHRFGLGPEPAYEVCYMLKRRHFHQGYAAEGIGAMLRYAAGQLGVSAVYAQIKTDNVPSMRAAERAGFLRQSVFIKHYNGKDMPHYLYKRSFANEKGSAQS